MDKVDSQMFEIVLSERNKAWEDLKEARSWARRLWLENQRLKKALREAEVFSAIHYSNGIVYQPTMTGNIRNPD